MGEELNHSLAPTGIFNIGIFGRNFTVTDTVVVMWLVMVALIVLSIVLTRNLKLVPEKKQGLAELLVEFVNNFTKNLMGHHWRTFAPYIGTLLLLLFFSNSVSIFNIIPSSEFMYRITGLELFEHLPSLAIRPPTRDANMTACLALISILVTLFSGIIIKNPIGWIKSFAHPMPVMVPFKILDYFVRPLSLCFRLFGNIVGAFIIMELLNKVIPIVLPSLFSLYFDLFDGLLQAYIFVFLTSIYISEAIE